MTALPGRVASRVTIGQLVAFAVRCLAVPIAVGFAVATARLCVMAVGAMRHRVVARALARPARRYMVRRFEAGDGRFIG